MISWFTSSSPMSGSVLIAQSLGSASDFVSPYLFAPPLLMLCLCLSLSKVIKTLKKKRKWSVYKGRQQEKKKKYGTIKHPENNKMVLISPSLSTTTLNINGLNSPIKRHRVGKMGKNKQTNKNKQTKKKSKRKNSNPPKTIKQDPATHYWQETHFSIKDTHRLKV